MPQDNNNFDAIRASVQTTGSDSRVEVNQRALIDKILARYATAGAVYRELLQNSNDAEATIAEIHFTTQEDNAKVVKQVLYRNNGIPFRPQDWQRLQKIAEGNPDPSKIGAFGVGAFTMFSICEEPLVISGSSSLCFVWKGDALWCRTAPLPRETLQSEWTSFVLPSRDPNPLPDLVEFGEFLCASLTFTQCLKHVRVLVNDQERLAITKTVVQEPRLVDTPRSSSWWSNQDGAVTTTPKGTFSLSCGSGSLLPGTPSSSSSPSIYESVQRITVQMDGTTSSMDARYVSAVAKTKVTGDMARRMVRVTKKEPPKQVQIQLFLNATRNVGSPRSPAENITQSFSPKPGAGRIFIGFRTSQTTGLAAHVAAPFVPTVEREAMDLQDSALRVFNLELLELAGILLRLTLEHTMYTHIDVAWKQNAGQRQALEDELMRQEKIKREEKSKRRAQEPEPSEAKTEIEVEETELESSKSSSSLMGFARFMARGVKKKIVSVVNTVEKLMDDGPDLLNPIDPRPLSEEEEDAIVLMQSFCPMQSTPDPLVGTALAQGFSRCLPSKTPPVLTRSGVVRGDEARLPNSGIEQFVKDNVVRSIVYKNCEEYHSVIAGCKEITLGDLLQVIREKPLEEDEMITLIKWFTKFKRIDSYGVSIISLHLKDAIQFYPASAKHTGGTNGEKTAIALSGLLFYVQKDSMLASKTLPMPNTVLSARLRDKIGSSTLADSTLQQWFNSLPIEIWSEFISHHASMTEARPEDEPLRIEILSILSKEFSHRSLSEREVFGGLCSALLRERPCVPSNHQTSERPSDLYVHSAELQAFEGIGSFHKVSAKLDDAGVSEEFLVCLGVRKSVAVDFLFENLASLKWSVDPRPLVEYLRKATLTRDDMRKLTNTQYLPADKDSSRLFAPPELYLPNNELSPFPFVRMLRWPSEPEVSERSDNGKFLQKFGMKHMPPLLQVLEYLSTADIDMETRIKCFDFLCDRLGPHGYYSSQYSRLSFSQRKELRFLPCTIKYPFEDAISSEMRSSITCFSEPSCGVMGFPVIDSELGENTKLYGSLFQCAPEPLASLLMHQLAHLVSTAKTLHRKSPSTAQKIMDSFVPIFKYLSHRASDIDGSALRRLDQESFIPHAVDGNLEWFRSDQVFFRSADSSNDTITEELFPVVEFSPFLAAAGVRQEASTKDLFKLLISSPEVVMTTLGSEKKYRSLLRRIAANPPFTQVTEEIRRSPFLLAYTMKAAQKIEPESSESVTYHLAKAADIYIIDNSFFGRMFSVNCAPPETDLEDFYFKLGSSYISKSVQRRFEVVGKPNGNTNLTRALGERLHERSTLLVSPNITTRPLVKNAASILVESNLKIFQASNIMAVYSLGGTTRRSRTTCFSRPIKGAQNSIYIVEDFDWFDVGYAIGDLILTRCQLEDAFFISSLLEAPLDQLRARGFPVDRIVQPEPKKIVPVEKPKEPTPAPETNKQDDETQKAGDSMPQTLNNAAAARAARSPGAASSDPVASASPTTKNQSKTPVENGRASGGMEEILMNMFPDADPSFLQTALGSNPSLDDIQRLADQMSSGRYPKALDDSSIAETSQTSSTIPPPMSRSENDESSLSPSSRKIGRNRLGKRLGKALGNLRGSNKVPQEVAAAAMSSGVSGAGGSIKAPSSGIGSKHENMNPVSPATDVQSQSGLERMLEQTVRGSTQVSRNGLESPAAQVSSSIPDGLDRGDTCEMLPGHSLKPFQGSRADEKTINGIRVFSARQDPTSEDFLRENEDCTEQFSLVLARLAEVYGLPIGSIAVFHDPAGGTIAFNSNKALHFNVRFFHSLHYLTNQQNSAACYGYWYITIAHELAHHLVSAHNKEHGFYTESYAAHYLPKLLALLGSLQV